MHKVITATVCTDATVSTAILINGGWDAVYIAAPLFSSGISTATCNVYVQGSNTSTSGTFARILEQGVYSGSSGIYAWETPSQNGPFLALAPAIGGFKYIRIETSKTATANAQFAVHLVRNI